MAVSLSSDPRVYNPNDTKQGAPWKHPQTGVMMQTMVDGQGQQYAVTAQSNTMAGTDQTGSGIGDAWRSGTTNTGSTNNLDVVKLSEGIVKDPKSVINGSTSLVDQSKDAQITGSEINSGIIDPNKSKYKMDTDALKQTAAQAQAAPDIAGVTPKTAQGYDAKTTASDVAAQDMTAQQGTVSSQAQVDQNAGQIDIAGIAAGSTPTGQALSEFASLDLDNIDPRATTKGQLAILQADFTGPNGEPKIPNYAQGAARAVSRIAAFNGMTGTAATAAMATAMMEASIQVADSDAKFYQTVTLQNLTNEQASIIQRAGILANFEMQNADNRMAAAIQNAQAFLAMDLKNLDNRQQSEVINTQNRVQSILEDAKAVNTARLFTAQSQNEMGMFYDNLNTQIKQFNNAQKNGMAQFNAGETNDMRQFNATLQNNREQFYKSMQFQIDTANAKWRQEVTLKNADMKFNAAAIDVKNAVDMSQEALNRLWDRSDAMLDYIWKSSENEKDRKRDLALGNLSANTQKTIAQMQADQADAAGLGSIFGTIAGNIAGSDKFLDWLF